MNALRAGCDFAEKGAIVVTGVGVVCALGGSARQLWENLVSEKPEKCRPPDPATGDSGCAPSSGAGPASPRTDLPPQLAKSMGKHLQLLLGSAEEAYNHAALGQGNLDPEKIAFFAGMGMIDYRVEDLLPAVVKSLSETGELDYDRFFSSGFREIYPLWPLAVLNNVVFCQVAIQFGIRGENCVFPPHGDAGIRAVAEAAGVLRSGKARAALAGGVSEEVRPVTLGRAAMSGVAGSFDPDGVCGGSAPFLGESGAMLIIEPLPSARRRGAGPLAELSGFGFACEKEPGKDHPSARAVSSAMEAALGGGGLAPEDIDLVFASGRANPRASAREREAIESVFGRNGCEVVSSGPIFGETFAAAPVVDAVLGVEILRSGRVPPVLFTVRAPRPGARKIERILINGASSEGQCASMILTRADRDGAQTA